MECACVFVCVRACECVRACGFRVCTFVSACVREVDDVDQRLRNFSSPEGQFCLFLLFNLPQARGQ